VPSSTRPRVR